MAIPIIYNFRSVKARWTSAIVAVLGIAGRSACLSPCFRWLAGFERRSSLRVQLTTR